MPIQDVTQENLLRRFDKIYLDFVDSVLHIGAERINQKNTIRSSLVQILGNTHVREELEEQPIASLAEALISKHERLLGESKEAMRSLKRRYRKDEEDQTLNAEKVIEEHKKRITTCSSTKKSLEKKLFDYRNPARIYAFVHPVKNEERESFRLVLPVPLHRRTAYGSLAEQLLSLLYTEMLGDGYLGNNNVQNMQQVAVSLPSGKIYVGIDLLGYEVEEGTMSEIMEYMKAFAENRINDRHNAQESAIRLANPLWQDNLFALSVIPSPITYKQFIEKSEEKLRSKEEAAKAKEKRLLDLVASSTNMKQDAVEETGLAGKILKFLYTEFSPEKDNGNKEDILQEVDESFAGYLNDLLGERVYTFSGAEKLISSSGHLVTIDGVNCVSLNHAAKLMQIHQYILERGFEAGTFKKVSAGGIDHISLTDLLNAPDKIVSSGRSLLFYNEPVLNLTDFCAVHQHIDRVTLREGIKTRAVPGVVKRDGRGPTIYAVRVAETEEVLRAYQSYIPREETSEE